MPEDLEIWTVYDHPLDDPAHWVARKFLVSKNGAIPTSVCHRSDSLEGLRAMLPSGLYCLQREPGDDPKIVESWL